MSFLKFILLFLFITSGVVYSNTQQQNKDLKFHISVYVPGKPLKTKIVNWSNKTNQTPYALDVLEESGYALSIGEETEFGKSIISIAGNATNNSFWSIRVWKNNEWAIAQNSVSRLKMNIPNNSLESGNKAIAFILTPNSKWDMSIDEVLPPPLAFQ